MNITQPQFAGDRHLSDLKSVLGQLSVSHIMTPRSQFFCCSFREPAQRVMARVPDIYDAVPVVDSHNPQNTSARVIGLLHRDRVPFRNSTISAAACADRSALETSHPVDRNLIDYILGLSGSPVEFVSSNGEVVGLVTPSDLERLPVRTALFAQIIDVERAMGDLINVYFPDTAAWEKEISPELSGKLKAGLKRARQNDSVGQSILSVDFAVKLDLLPHCFSGSMDAHWVNWESNKIRELRNNVAHGAPFPEITRLPEQVRNLLLLRRKILDKIEDIGANKK